MKFAEFDPIKVENESKITVFGKKGCMQCKMTASIFTDNDIDFDYIDIEDVKKAHRNLEQAIEHYENRGAGIL